MFNLFKRKDKPPEIQKPVQETVNSRTFEWQKSRAHVNLLSHFVEPRDTNVITKFEKWIEPLGEPVQVAIKRFLDLSLLQRADSANHLLAIYNSTDLKRFLKERGLPQSGTKEVMSKRLAEHDEHGVQRLLTDHFVLICTEQGNKIAEAYEQYEITRRKDAIHLSEKCLSERNYRKAVLTMADYEAKCVFKRGMNISWEKYNTNRDEVMLRYIFTRTPQALIKRGWDKSENTRIAAGMIHLWGNDKLADLTCSFEIIAAAQLLISHAHNLYELDDCRETGIKYIIVQTCNDNGVCSACRKVARRKKYRLDEVPEFPLADCTDEGGCRCWITPIFD